MIKQLAKTNQMMDNSMRNSGINAGINNVISINKVVKSNNTMAGSALSGNAGSVRWALRTDLHIIRKLWHMITGLTIALTYLAGIKFSTGILILSSIFVFALLVETARLRIPAVNEMVLRLWGPFMRRSELYQVSGTTHYLLATIVAIVVFPKPVAVLSILYLAIGDPMASFVGVLYGRYGMRWSNGKSLIGTLAGVLTCSLIGFVYFRGVLGLQAQIAVTLSLIGGIAGGITELLPLELDDNLTIPVVSGFVLWLAFIAFGI